MGCVLFYMLYHRDQRTLIYGMWESNLIIFPLRVNHYDDQQQADAKLTHNHRARLYHNAFDDGTYVMSFNNDDPACVWYGMTVVEDISEEAYTRVMYNHQTDELVRQTYSEGAESAQLTEHDIIESASQHNIPTDTTELVDLLEDVLDGGIEIVRTGGDIIDTTTETEPVTATSDDEQTNFDGFQTAADAR